MKRTNIVYWAILPLGALLAYIFWGGAQQPVAFYGFAETAETRINHREPLVIQAIHVQPGDAVEAGEILLEAKQIRDPKGAVSQPFEIAELEAKERVWKAGLDDELRLLEERQALAVSKLTQEITEARERLAYQQALSAGLKTVQDRGASQRLQREIDGLTAELEQLRKTQQLALTRLRNRQARERSPFRETVKRLEAEQTFDAAQLERPVQVRAPADGLVGNLQCEVTEYVDAFSPLLVFYEPNPSVVRGYVHEDLRMRVAVGDRFEVQSLVNANAAYTGTVTGLGSRIVEIPARLRKLPEIRLYGREVTIQIPANNELLQKEKVSLRHLGPATAVPSREALK